MVVDIDKINTTGISIRELQQTLRRTQAGIQQALTSLLKRKFITRRKERRAYLYNPSSFAFQSLQTCLIPYQEALINYIQPYTTNSNPSMAIKQIHSQLEEKMGYFRLGG